MVWSILIYLSLLSTWIRMNLIAVQSHDTYCSFRYHTNFTYFQWAMQLSSLNLYCILKFFTFLLSLAICEIHLNYQLKFFIDLFLSTHISLSNKPFIYSIMRMLIDISWIIKSQFTSKNYQIINKIRSNKNDFIPTLKISINA